MSNRVVVHFLGGTVLKGTSLDVDPTKPKCHIRPETGPVQEVRLADLKALFFVRTLEGNKEHHEAKNTASDDPRARGSAPITVRFADGETIVGLTNRYPPIKPYFFIVPADAASNNIRILVNRAAVVSMESTPAA